MSHAKVAASGDIPARIIFYYKIDDLLKSVQARSMAVARVIKNDKGKPSTEEYGITDDNRDSIIEFYLREAVTEVFGQLDSLTFGLTDTLVFNAEYSTAGVVIGKYVLDKNGFSSDSLGTIDSAMYNMFKNHVLKSWFSNNGLFDQAKLFDIEYQKHDQIFNDKKSLLYKADLT